MKILIHISHPKYFHAAKNIIKTLQKENHQVFIIARDFQFILNLLEKNNIPFVITGKGSTTIFGRAIYFIKTLLLYRMKSGLRKI